MRNGGEEERKTRKDKERSRGREEETWEEMRRGGDKESWNGEEEGRRGWEEEMMRVGA